MIWIFADKERERTHRSMCWPILNTPETGETEKSLNNMLAILIVPEEEKKRETT